MKFTKNMKSRFKLLSIAAVAAVVSLTGNKVFAQASYEETFATWSCKPITANAGGAAPAPLTNSTVAPSGANVIVSPITKAAGVGATTGSDEYGGIGFTNVSEAAAITASNYISYTIQAAPGYSISFQTNYFFVFALAAGGHTNVLQYSADGISYIDLSTNIIPSGNSSTTWTNNCAGFPQLQNVASTVTNYFRIVAWGGTGTAALWVIDDPPSGSTGVGTNDILILGDLSAATVAAPTNAVVAPASQTVNAGQNITFTVSAGGFPASNSWYQIANNTTNLIVGATNATLTLNGVFGGNGGGYFAILTNSSGSATSEVATLIVTNDPNIQSGPNNTYGLVDGIVQFSANVFGSGPVSYQWFFADHSGNAIAPANNGNTTASGAVIFGQGTSVLSISNVQTADLTNFIVVISNLFGKQTSSVASILGVTNVFFNYAPPYFGFEPPITPLAFWDFNGPIFTNTFANPNAEALPSPYLGAGMATPVGSCNNLPTSPFAGSADPSDGPGFDTIVPSW